LPTVTLSLDLFGDCAHHIVSQLDSSDYDIRDLDTPCLGLAVQDRLDISMSPSVARPIWTFVEFS